MRIFAVFSQADAGIVIGLFVLIGTVYSAWVNTRTRKAVNGDLHDRLDSIEGKVDAIVSEVAHEKVRAQMAEAEILARLERHG